MQDQSSLKEDKVPKFDPQLVKQRRLEVQKSLAEKFVNLFETESDLLMDKINLKTDEEREFILDRIKNTSNIETAKKILRLSIDMSIDNTESQYKALSDGQFLMRYSTNLQEIKDPKVHKSILLTPSQTVVSEKYENEIEETNEEENKKVKEEIKDQNKGKEVNKIKSQTVGSGIVAEKKSTKSQKMKIKDVEDGDKTGEEKKENLGGEKESIASAVEMFEIKKPFIGKDDLQASDMFNTYHQVTQQIPKLYTVNSLEEIINKSIMVLEKDLNDSVKKKVNEDFNVEVAENAIEAVVGKVDTVSDYLSIYGTDYKNEDENEYKADDIIEDAEIDVNKDYMQKSKKYSKAVSNKYSKESVKEGSKVHVKESFPIDEMMDSKSSVKKVSKMIEKEVLKVDAQEDANIDVKENIIIDLEEGNNEEFDIFKVQGVEDSKIEIVDASKIEGKEVSNIDLKKSVKKDLKEDSSHFSMKQEDTFGNQREVSDTVSQD